MPDILRIALTVTCGGAVGGLLYWTSLYLASTSATDTQGKGFRDTRAFCMAQLFMGIGGAWAVLLLTLWGKRAATAHTLCDILELVATSLVAGFAGGKLLPMVADQLTRQLLKETQRKVAQDAKRAAKSELTAEVYTYLDVSGSQTGHQTALYVRKLKTELENHPTNRKAAILLARLLDEVKHSPGKAIEVLETFIRSKSAGGSLDADVADCYWNIANYREEQFAASGDRKYRLAAIDAVQKSIAIVPGYLKNVKEDADFADLRQDVEAKTKLPGL